MMLSGISPREFQRMAEVARRVFEFYHTHQAAIEQARRMADMINWGAIERLNRRYEQMQHIGMLPLISGAVAVRQRMDALASLKGMIAATGVGLTEIAQQQATLKAYQVQLSQASPLSSLGSIADAIQRSQAVMDAAVLQADIISAQRTAALVLRPPILLHKFAEDTLTEAKEATGERQTALVASVDIANAITQDTCETVAQTLDLVIPGSIRPQPFPASLPRSNILEVARYECIAVLQADAGALEDDTIVKRFVTTNVNAMNKGIAAAVLNCNTLSDTLEGQDRIFTWTNKVVESLLLLQERVVLEASQLCEVVDWLYFILYEGAGGDNLRYLAMNLVSDQEAEIVWDVKHLRNYYSCHDVEHGKASDIRKKRIQLADTYERLIGKPLPSLQEDFLHAQVQLLSRARAFVELVFERLKLA